MIITTVMLYSVTYIHNKILSMGRRSLRYTGDKIYKTRVDVPGQGRGTSGIRLEEQIEAGGEEKRKELQDFVGGRSTCRSTCSEL